jgi:SAM-dependent methyltransferase
MYRWPQDTPRFSQSFYQRRYSQGMTTGMPNRESLEKFRTSMFRGTEKDLSDKIAVLKVLIPRGRVLDYGCSWGYGTFQLVAAGYDAVGFEISHARAAFGRARLGLKIISCESALDGFAQSFDAVFASHVLEHLSAPAPVFDRLANLLKPNGLLVAFVPNCGGDEARRLGVTWGPMCCEKHPLAFDPQFLERVLPRHGFQVSTFSNPYSFAIIEHALKHPGAPRNLHGNELMICARRINGRPTAGAFAEKLTLGG